MSDMLGRIGDDDNAEAHPSPVDTVDTMEPVASLTVQEEPHPNPITEEMGLHKEWFIQAREQTLESLPEFIRHLIQDYGHDYGTIVNACVAAGIAGIQAVNHDPKQGGITGFQAGCVMWGFMREWMHYDSPMLLRNYGNMLYPQYKKEFAQTISKDTWAWLQAEAKRKLAEANTVQSEVGSYNTVHVHWESIVAGTVPFGFTVSEDD